MYLRTHIGKMCTAKKYLAYFIKNLYFLLLKCFYFYKRSQNLKTYT